jgi:hypothetical protein
MEVAVVVELIALFVQVVQVEVLVVYYTSKLLLFQLLLIQVVVEAVEHLVQHPFQEVLEVLV